MVNMNIMNIVVTLYLAFFILNTNILYIYLLSQTILGKTSVHYAAEKGYKDIIQLFSLHAISSVCDQDEFGKHWNIRRVKLL